MFDSPEPSSSEPDDGWIPVDSEGFAPEFPFDDGDGRYDDGGDSYASARDLSVGEVLAGLLAQPPDAYVTLQLSGIDPRTLAPEDAITWLQVDQRVTAWRAAAEAGAYVAAGSGHAQVQELWVLDPRPDHFDERLVRIEDVAREEIAVALRLSTQATHERLVFSRLLTGPLGATLDAMATGEITASHARVVTEAARRLPGCLATIGTAATSTLPVDVAERVEFARLCSRLQDRVVPVAARGTLAQTRACAQRAVLAIDADGQARRRAMARKTRDAFVLPGDDGHALLGIRMATETAHACLAKVNALAHDPSFVTDCDATIGERRAEAAAALLLAAGSSASGVPEPGLRAHVDITMDLATFLGMQDALGDAPVGTDGAVAEIAGVGAVSADVVRGLLADPDVAVTMRRLVTDPMTGYLLDYGRRTYAVPDRLRDFITARDRTCRFPGCRRKASRCQADHATAWDDGGDTSPANTGPLCVRHHQQKTHAGWTISNSRPDGSCTWTSPHGRHYEHEPEPLAPVKAKGPRPGTEAARLKELYDRWERERPPKPATDTDAPQF